MIINAFTVDVEEYFHVSGLQVDSSQWESLPSRVEIGIERLRRLLDQHHVRATFFVLGWTAKRKPELIRSLARDGHEIASHGYWHRLVYDLDADDFLRDCLAAREILGTLTESDVQGYRAPSFSFTPACPWAYEVLSEAGHTFDSSVSPASPIIHRRYGYPGAAVDPALADERIREFPVTTFNLGFRRIPAAGGAWLRHLPVALSVHAIRQANKRGAPAMVYVHPWELDPNQPRLAAPLKARVAHYRNLEETHARLERLLGTFSFGPMSESLRLFGL